MSEYSKYFPLVKLVTYTFGSIAIAVGLSTLTTYSHEEIYDEHLPGEERSKRLNHNFIHDLVSSPALRASLVVEDDKRISGQNNELDQLLEQKYKEILDRQHQKGYK